ncbi:MAG: hypothetical protein DMG57_10695 [Acidobacteria bacterium]|nr:MAG: hypothetical protein DMG57_10695 [Acidobacteriota bacterium]
MHLIVTGQAGIHFHEDIPVQTESGLNIGRSAGATDKKGRPKSAAPVPASRMVSIKTSQVGSGNRLFSRRNVLVIIQ